MSVTLMPVVRVDDAAIRESYYDVIVGFHGSTGQKLSVETERDIRKYVNELEISAPVRKTTIRKKRTSEEIEEAERVKRENKEALAAKRKAAKEAKTKAKEEAKAAKLAEKAAKAAAKAAEKGAWFAPKRLVDPNGGEDPKGKNGSFVRYQHHRTSDEMRLINPNNWTDENKKILETVLANDKAKKAKKASVPDLSKSLKDIAKKNAKKEKPKMSIAEKKAALKKKAAEAKKAKAEAEAKAKAEAEAKTEESPEDIELDEEVFGDSDEGEAFDEIEDECSIRKPFTWDKKPDMELWEDSDKWVWDGIHDDANPILYYDEEEEEYVIAPGCDDLLD